MNDEVDALVSRDSDLDESRGLGRVADPPPSATTTESVLPSSPPDSAPVDDPPLPITTDSTAAPASTSVDADGLEALSAEERSLIDSWRSAVSASSGEWPGFDLALIPTVLVAVDIDGAVEAVVVFNHSNPLSLGVTTQRIDVDGYEVAVIAEMADPEWLAARAPYDFFADVGGTETFVLIAQEGELGRESGTPEFAAMLVHEAFHRYQWDEWTPGTARQYVDRYDFSAANLELVLLEHRILIAAYHADDPGDPERLARQFAAVRATRRQRDFRVAHDEETERSEGSARFIEEPATGLGHDGEFVLTDTQLACLEALGIEFSDTSVFGDRIGIPQNVADECLNEADDSDGESP